MTDKDFGSIDGLAASCRDDADHLAEALRFGGEGTLRIEVGPPHPFDPNSLPAGWRGSGAILRTGSTDGCFLWLVPLDVFPAEWRTVSESDRDARLRRAAVELGEAVFGDPQAAGLCDGREVASLAADPVVAGIGGTARMVELIVHDDASRDERGRVCVAGPMRVGDHTHAEGLGANGADGDDEPSPIEDAARAAHRFEPAAHAFSMPTSAESLPDRDLPAAARRLTKLPVTVVVRLAEKRIEMRQLLSMTVGTMIMFDKTCEAPLELFVNNRLYCQGEAVKIGEKFGLKVDQVGPRSNREERILYG